MTEDGEKLADHGGLGPGCELIRDRVKKLCMLVNNLDDVIKVI